ncbi:MAG: cytochrome C oxidase subunit IV family protein [Acidimicrobiia bacterium]
MTSSNETASAVQTTQQKAALRGRTRLGLRVGLGLAVLTAIEFVIAVSIEDPLVWLLPFMVSKGWLILDYFMHVRDVSSEGGR